MIDFEKGIKGIKKVFSLNYQGDDMDFSVDIIGNSIEDCRVQLSRWLNGETTVRIKTMENEVINENVNEKVSEIVPNITNVTNAVEVETGEVKTKSNRGQHFIGTTWVVNSDLKDKKRIPVSELDAYLAKGYVKGGPRSKFS
jgi:DUF438 domain-containing protein